MRKFIQYYTAMCGNMLTISVGLSLGWPSPVLPLLLSKVTPLASGPITTHEAATIASLLLIGSLFGAIISGLVADKYGRKIAIYLIAIPSILCWILILVATNVYYLYAARFLTGISTGGVFLVIPMYVTEICETNIRGKLGSFLQVAQSLGLLGQYIIGAYFNYYVIATIPLIFPVVFLIGFAFLPETPAYLVARHRIEEAEKSLKFYRGCWATDIEIPHIVIEELDDMKRKVNNVKMKYSTLTISDFTNRSAWVGTLLSFVLLISLSCSGAGLILMYTSMLFEETGSIFSPNISAILVGVSALVGSNISPLIVERAGRRPLLLVSSFTAGVFFTIVGIYCHLRNNGYDVSSYSWISIVGLCGSIFCSSIGILSLGPPIVTELLLIKIRALIIILGRIQMYLYGFLILLYWFDAIDLFGVDGCLCFFAVYNFVYFIIIARWFQETKGKSIDDIVKSLGEK